MTIIVMPLAMLASALRNFRVHYPDQSLLLLEVTNLTIVINLFEAIVTLFLCFIGAVYYGPIGAVYGCVLGSLLGCLIGFLLPVMLHGLPIFWKDFVKISMATLIMSTSLFTVTRFVTSDSLYQTLVVQIVFSFCVYALFIFFAYYTEAKTIIRSLLNKNLNAIS
jgi:O-antigen/teichoic acid export membrane protein